MAYFFLETPEHADNFYTEWLKKFEGKYPPVDYKFSNRHLLFVKLLNKFALTKDVKILDVGCGLGDLLFLLKKEGYQNIVGIDHSYIAVDLCKRNGFNVIRASLEEELPFEIRDTKYDFIILGDILEHFYVPAHTLLQLKSLLSDNGKLIVSVPNAGWIMNGILLSFFPQMLWLSVMFASWTHINFFTFYSLKQELRACGYKILWLGGVEPELIDCSKMKIRAKVVFGIFNIFLTVSKFLVKYIPNLFSQHIIAVIEKDGNIDLEYLKKYDINV